MIWDTVSSRCSFYWLYRASPSLATKNIISLISYWPSREMPTSMCRVVSCVVGEGCLLWPVCSLDKTVLSLPCFILYSKAKLACYSGYLLTSYFCFPIKKISFLVLILEGVQGLHRTGQLFWCQWLGHRLELLWCWVVCLGAALRSFCHFWDCTQVLHFRLFCWLWWLLHFFCGILVHIVDIMVIWIKFSHSF